MRIIKRIDEFIDEFKKINKSLHKSLNKSLHKSLHKSLNKSLNESVKWISVFDGFGVQINKVNKYEIIEKEFGELIDYISNDMDVELKDIKKIYKSFLREDGDLGHVDELDNVVDNYLRVKFDNVDDDLLALDFGFNKDIVINDLTRYAAMIILKFIFYMIQTYDRYTNSTNSYDINYFYDKFYEVYDYEKGLNIKFINLYYKNETVLHTIVGPMYK